MKKLNLRSKLSSKPVLVTVAVVSGLAVGGLGITQSEAAMDWLGLEQKLTNHDEQLANHDDRIQNVEKDVDKVQEETNVEPSTEKVIVREVITENPTVKNTEESQPAPTPDPEPVKVVKAEKIVVDENRTDCKYTYSDGTTKQFKWRWTFINQQGLQQTSTNGFCDQSSVEN